MRWSILAASIGLAAACSSDEPGSSTSGGAGGTDSSGGAEVGGSGGETSGGSGGADASGGAPGGNAAGGSAGSAGSIGDAGAEDVTFYEDMDCVAMCGMIDAEMCLGEQTPEECASNCTVTITTGNCVEEMKAALSCILNGGTIDCQDGQPNSPECESELGAVFACQE